MVLWGGQRDLALHVKLGLSVLELVAGEKVKVVVERLQHSENLVSCALLHIQVVVDVPVGINGPVLALASHDLLGRVVKVVDVQDGLAA